MISLDDMKTARMMRDAAAMQVRIRTGVRPYPGKKFPAWFIGKTGFLLEADVARTSRGNFMHSRGDMRVYKLDEVEVLSIGDGTDVQQALPPGIAVRIRETVERIYEYLDRGAHVVLKLADGGEVTRPVLFMLNNMKPIKKP